MISWWHIILLLACSLITVVGLCILSVRMLHCAGQCGEVIIGSALMGWMRSRRATAIGRGRTQASSDEAFRSIGIAPDVQAAVEIAVRDEASIRIVLYPSDSLSGDLSMRPEEQKGVLISLSDTLGLWWPDVRSALAQETDLTVGQICEAAQRVRRAATSEA